MKQYRSAVMVLGILMICGISISLNAQTDRGKPVRPQGNRESAIAQRLALVIGNGNYAEKPLSNPYNDAQDMAEVLEQLGFDVIKKTNLDHRGMKTAVREFGQRLKYGGGVGLFYYAGHGFQYQNQNYLVPIGADIQSEADIEYELFHAGYVLSQMEYANNGMNIVILDACRSIPFRRSFTRDVGQGLAMMDAPKGAVIAFATAPNETAADGAGRNGTFTKHLLAALRSNPCRSISDLLIEVTGNVDRETNGRQVPWQHLSLTRPFQLAVCEPQQPTPTPIPVVRQPTPTPVPPGKWTDPVTNMEFVWIEEGCFQMGSPSSETGRESDEGPVHQVCVDGFWMGKYEVTNAQYRTWKRDHNSKEYKGHSLNSDSQPAVYVSWKKATEFAQWLTKQHLAQSPLEGGRGVFRLPTEAEWEYAARAGTTTARFWGDNPDDACEYANVRDHTTKQTFPGWDDWEDYPPHDCTDGYAVTAPVGQFRSNAFGLYDMVGNVWEWTADWYHSKYYAKSPRDNPTGPESGSYHVLRGGGWYTGARYCRSADRGRNSPGYRDDFLGFRLLRMP